MAPDGSFICTFFRLIAVGTLMEISPVVSFVVMVKMCIRDSVHAARNLVSKFRYQV